MRSKQSDYYHIAIKQSILLFFIYETFFITLSFIYLEAVSQLTVGDYYMTPDNINATINIKNIGTGEYVGPSTTASWRMAITALRVIAKL